PPAPPPPRRPAPPGQQPRRRRRRLVMARLAPAGHDRQPVHRHPTARLRYRRPHPAARHSPPPPTAPAHTHRPTRPPPPPPPRRPARPRGPLPQPLHRGDHAEQALPPPQWLLPCLLTTHKRS